jgi:hypothetical protein
MSISGAGNIDNEVHISLDEYYTSRPVSTVGFFINESWGVWKTLHLFPSTGSCIGVLQRLLVVVPCIKTLPFVCEMYKIICLNLVNPY